MFAMKKSAGPSKSKCGCGSCSACSSAARAHVAGEPPERSPVARSRGSAEVRDRGTASSPFGYGAQAAGAAGPTFDFVPIQMAPPHASAPTAVDIPSAMADDRSIIDQPATSGGSATPTPAAGDSCSQPRSMHKLTSGTFLGGLTMDSYFPDLAGAGVYLHPDTAGAFDTGSRAGANIQLYGVIPSPCRPEQFSLAQTITRTRFRINGVTHPEEGRTFDDIAKSGRDASTAPFRQEFLGGGSAPLGYIISMADPPSTGYGPSDTIEHDRDFVTSLVGPGGTQSVSWSLSTRITAGAVTRNELT